MWEVLHSPSSIELFFIHLIENPGTWQQSLYALLYRRAHCSISHGLEMRDEKRILNQKCFCCFRCHTDLKDVWVNSYAICIMCIYYIGTISRSLTTQNHVTQGEKIKFCSLWQTSFAAWFKCSLALWLWPLKNRNGTATATVGDEEIWTIIQGVS